MYVSNENATLVDVYFDDIVMTHTKGNVVQYNEYYPFGLQTANSWTRENTTGNNFLGNGGTELNTTSNLYDLQYRNYDPILGRMNQVDPMATKYASLTPYNFSFNDPVMFNDPLGDDAGSLADWDRLGKSIGRTNRMNENRREAEGWRANVRAMYGVVGDDDLFPKYGVNSLQSLDGFMSETEASNGLVELANLMGLDHVKNISQGEWVPKWSIKYKRYKDGVEQYLKVTLIGFVKVEQTQGECSSCGFADVLRNSPFFVINTPNPFYMAEAIYFDVGGSFLGHEVDRGGFYVLIGKDKGKFFSYKEKSIYGTGTDAGAAGEIGRIDVTGNPYLFTSDFVYGYRDKFWAGGGEGPSIGLAFSLGSYNGQTVTATALQIGWSFLPISLGWNKGILSPTN